MSAAGRRNATLTARDREICAAIGPTLREQGMIFVGIDVIGDWLTEINVTSPTGIQEIDAVRRRQHLERRSGTGSRRSGPRSQKPNPPPDRQWRSCR